jgi:hypothetical protein
MFHWLYMYPIWGYNDLVRRRKTSQIQPNRGDCMVSSLSDAKAMAEQDLDPHVKIAVYGPPGVGKTGFASDIDLSVFPVTDEETLYLNVESGKLTLKVLGRRCKVIDIIKMVANPAERDTRKKAGLPIDPFGHFELIHRDLLAGGHGFKTVIIDSLSSLQKEDLDTVAQVTMDKSNGAARIHGIYGKQQADYGINTDKMRWLMRAYRDLPMNVVFILGETRDKDAAGGVTIVPDLTPKLRESMYPMMDVVAYMYNTTAALGDGSEHAEGALKRILLTSPAYPQYKTKDRSDAMGGFMVDVTLPHVLRAIADKIAASNA